MVSLPYIISEFKSVRPRFESSQQNILEWIVAAHTQAEAKKQGILFTPEKKEAFRASLKAQLLRVGCKPDTIHYRGHEISDFLHENWQEMLIYRLEDAPEGVTLGIRQETHERIADHYLGNMYSPDATPPDYLIHVSCTGYSAPSCAQKFVSRRDWGRKTLVTHAYHMGCYASIPAIRMASAFIQQKGERADLVHTELCTLHNNPSLHAPDQLIAQSLFADGLIKYSLFPEKDSQREGLRILAVNEQIVPDSLDAMTWLLKDWGFQLTLAKEIPVLIAKHVQEFVRALVQQAGLTDSELYERGIFAIHPGGPKILEYIQKILGIRSDQLNVSREILQRYGNMSSATLPHIWEAICLDETIPKTTKVISLAFGPGLSIAGIIFEKV